MRKIAVSDFCKKSDTQTLFFYEGGQIKQCVLETKTLAF